jgi:hypothetical protein
LEHYNRDALEARLIAAPDAPTSGMRSENQHTPSEFPI